jgi:uncharacterized protein
MNPSAQQALAETRAWVDRVVIGLNLCPFAKAVQVRNQVRSVVSAATDVEALLSELLDEMSRLVATDTEVLGDMTNATNRSPYPTLHLLREDSVDRAVAAFPGAEAICQKNNLALATLGAEGLAVLQAQCRSDAAARQAASAAELRLLLERRREAMKRFKKHDVTQIFSIPVVAFAVSPLGHLNIHRIC